MLDLTKGFSVGINLDDPWRYAGLKEPKSTIIPHLLSVSLPEGRVLEEADEATIKMHGETDPISAAGRAILSLADDLKDLGVQFVRCWFPWNFFEPSPIPSDQLDQLLERSYEEWPLDPLVTELTSRDIGIVPVLACGYQRMLPRGLDVDRTPDVYLKRASVHARLLARKYRGRVKYWQIENEPNWWKMHEAGGWRRGASWLESGGFAADLLGELNRAVHDEDPGAITIVNMEGDEGIPQAQAYSEFCDLVGLDFYPNYRAAIPVDTEPLKKASEVARATGKPTFISETGYPSGPGLLGYSEERQAEYLKMAVEMVHSEGALTALGVWRFSDGSWRSFPEQENHFGLIDSKGRRKLAWGILQDTLRGLA